MIRTAVVDDDPIVLDGLITLLGIAPDITVAATGADGLDAVDLVENRRADLDVVLLDVRMPRLDGLSAARRILAGTDAPPVVMMTTFDDDEYLAESLRIGAAGFVLKRSGAAELANAVRTVAGGNSVLYPERVRDLFAARKTTPLRDRPHLTPTERVVLGEIVAGRENREIAERLVVAPQTIKTHVSSILAKLGARNRTHAAVIAIDADLLDDPPPGRAVERRITRTR